MSQTVADRPCVVELVTDPAVPPGPVPRRMSDGPAYRAR